MRRRRTRNTIRDLRDSLAAWVGRTGLKIAARIRAKR